MSERWDDLEYDDDFDLDDVYDMMEDYEELEGVSEGELNDYLFGGDPFALPGNADEQMESFMEGYDEGVRDADYLLAHDQEFQDNVSVSEAYEEGYKLGFDQHFSGEDADDGDD
jgi:hypothetical protein